MGHIRVEARQEAEDYIPDHFSHATLVHEVHVEIPYAREGLIVPDAFWEKLEATYLSDPRETLRHHECPVLDSILRHDHLPVQPDTITTISPPPIIRQTTGTVSPPTGSSTHEPGGPQQINGVPEPSSIVLAGLAVLMISVCVLTRALCRRRQSFVPWLGANARG
jgi:hypothetical protein